VALAASLAAGSPAAAHEHDSRRAGHPLRLIAYALHPVGVIVDRLVLRPGHWLVHHEPLRTLFGHEDA
jgi:hypothetical protein